MREDCHFVITIAQRIQDLFATKTIVEISLTISTGEPGNDHKCEVVKQCMKI